MIRRGMKLMGINVIRVLANRSEIIFTSRNGGNGDDYERIGPDSWNIRMGESWEPVYSDKEIKDLESAYQEFMNAK
jgi:hypothetical protein